jgi:hypothetical protein
MVKMEDYWDGSGGAGEGGEVDQEGGVVEGPGKEEDLCG